MNVRPKPTIRPDAVNHADVDVQGLQSALRATVRGEIHFDDGFRAIYSTDASNYRQVPVGVVLPIDAEDVESAIAACRRFGAPVLARGGGTSLAGETCNAAVVLDFTKHMHRVLDIDAARRLARAQPGCVLDDLRDEAKRQGLTFGPDPATHNRNTLGGMIGNNSCGMHAQMAGKTEENVESLEILTYDGLRMTVGATSDDELAAIIESGGRRGEIYAALRALRDRYADEIRARFPKLRRRISGFSLDELLPEKGFHVARALVGTENTCVTILEATCRLVPEPRVKRILVLGFSDIATAGDHVPLCDGFGPIALEGLDDSMFRYMRDKGMSTSSRDLFPDGGAWLIVEFGGDTAQETEAKAHALMDRVHALDHPPSMRLFDDPEAQRELWEVRESGLGSTSKIPNLPDFYPGWEDSAVPPEHLGAYLRDLQKLMDRYGYHASLYGHFGQGCVHGSIDFDLFTSAGIQRYREFVTEAAHLCVGYEGSLSGEHGDGQSRGELLPIMYGDDLVRAFGEFKSIWDPSNKMNPGKVVHPYRLDQNLRWGPTYRPWDPPTRFHFRQDRGSFAFAANRCVGTGKCRKHDSGTMCPSYMATRDEMHSTRGRARLLFEMLEGDPLRRGWQDESVKEALDLCLACKGCKSECPVGVDMATYKAEFLSHYYEGRRRPLAAYAFGLLPAFARVLSRVPALVNALTHVPPFSWIAKALVSVEQQRDIPLFARQTFRDWFSRRRPSAAVPGATEVVLWADTWNNYFLPNAARAATEVLEAAGFRVTVPEQSLCCGRPLYDYGMLDLAKQYLEDVMKAVGPALERGAWIVGLEPSCMSVFRDELMDLFPDDPRAKRLRDRSLLLGEFLTRVAPHQRFGSLRRRVVMQGHCHQKAVLDMRSDETLLRGLGCEVQTLDSGCCGMAGAFGFERGAHFDVSRKSAERVLLPAVRAAEPEDLIVASGFSCREQIRQMTRRDALHVAEVLRMALDGDRGEDAAEPYPERRFVADHRAANRRYERWGAAAILAGAAVAALWVTFGRRRF